MWFEIICPKSFSTQSTHPHTIIICYVVYKRGIISIWLLDSNCCVDCYYFNQQGFFSGVFIYFSFPPLSRSVQCVLMRFSPIRSTCTLHTHIHGGTVLARSIHSHRHRMFLHMYTLVARIHSHKHVCYIHWQWWTVPHCSVYVLHRVGVHVFVCHACVSTVCFDCSSQTRGLQPIYGYDNSVRTANFVQSARAGNILCFYPSTTFLRCSGSSWIWKQFDL